MSLLACSECGQPLSTEASSCPHCGKPARKKTSVATMGCVCLLLAVIAVIVIPLIAQGGRGPESPIRSDSHENSAKNIDDVSARRSGSLGDTQHEVRDYSRSAVNAAIERIRHERGIRIPTDVVQPTGWIAASNENNEFIVVVSAIIEDKAADFGTARRFSLVYLRWVKELDTFAFHEKIPVQDLGSDYKRSDIEPIREYMDRISWDDDSKGQPNEEYERWAKFRVGAWVKYRTDIRSKDGQSMGPTEITYRLVECTRRRVLLERYPVIGRDKPDRWEEQAKRGTPIPKRVITEEREVEIEVAKGPVTCHWIKTSQSEEWMCSSIPGGIAMRRSTLAGGTALTTVVAYQGEPR